jgi:hypothetical protein
LSVHAFRAKNTNVLSTPSLLTRFSAMWLLSFSQNSRWC